MKELESKDVEKNSQSKSVKENNEVKDKINLDYDWNSEYGDGDIPEVDK